MKKIKKLWLSRIIQNYILLFLCFLFLELLFHLIDGIPILNIASLRVFIGLQILSLFIGYILALFPRIINKIILILLVFIATIYGICELGFHHYLGVYASISSNTQIGAVTSYIGDFLGSFKPIFYLLLLPFLLLLIYYIFVEKKVTLTLPKRKFSQQLIFFKMIPIFFLFLLSFLYLVSLKASFMQDKLQSTTAYELFKKPANASLVIRGFGYIGYGILDLKEYFFPGEYTLYTDIDSQKLEEQLDELESDKTSFNHVTIDQDQWLELIDQESDQDYNTLNQYFIQNQVSLSNSYTGLFEGKNLIMIMVESGSEILFNEEYFPNIKRLTDNGYTFLNNYSPRNVCSTGNNEMSAMISLYSINNNCTANVYQNNTYFESIFNLFNQKDYITNSFHDYYDWYYNRSVIHKNMGSMNYYDAVDLKLDFSYKYPAYDTWPSDSQLISSYLNILDEQNKDQPFMSFITTVTSHMPYNLSSKYGDMYMDLFAEEYPVEVKRYLSKLKIVDQAIGMLLDGLDERGILDDTVIVLFADHYPYSIDIDKLNVLYDYDLSQDNNADQVPFIIFNSELEKKEIDFYTSYIDILPTLANLFNLEYDSRLYMGQDIFSDSFESLVIFNDGSWKNEKAFYDASTSKLHYYTKNTYTDEEILAINTKVRLKLEMSSLAIRKNYFHYLEEQLNNVATSNERKDEL